MKNLGRALLLVGVLVLALLIGILVGRGRKVQATAEGNAPAVQITTAAPPAAAPPAPLPAPVAAPPVVAPPRIPLDAQVQEDAAAVGMTTREDEEPASEPAPVAGPHTADAGVATDPPT
jgi:hypothetical protein